MEIPRGNKCRSANVRTTRFQLAPTECLANLIRSAIPTFFIFAGFHQVSGSLMGPLHVAAGRACPLGAGTIASVTTWWIHRARRSRRQRKLLEIEAGRSSLIPPNWWQARSDAGRPTLLIT